MFEQLRRAVQLGRAARQREQEASPKRRAQELEFYPAAVEILESPPSPFTRTLMLLICAMLLFALTWSWFGFIDIEAVAQGKVSPKGGVKMVESLIIGRVQRIHVLEGDLVKQGQLLVTMDPIEAEADVRQATASLLYHQLNLGRLQMLMAISEQQATGRHDLRHWFSDQQVALVGRPTDSQWHQQNQLLNFDYQRYQSGDHSMYQEQLQRVATIEAVQAEISRFRELTPLHEQTEQAIRALYEKGHTSRLDWLQAKEKQVDSRQQLIVQMKRLNEANAALTAITSDRERWQKEFRQERMAQLNDYNDRVDELQQSLVKTRQKLEDSVIRAPVDGTVQKIMVSSSGSVTEPGETVMEIVPTNVALQVKAMVLNKDIGFIRTGMPVDIKIESFPYTFYGSLSGEVSKIAKDAVEQEGLGLVYPVTIKLQQQQVSVDGHRQPLEVDMMVTADIKIGQRRLLEFFMEPFLRYRDESLTVR